MCTVLTHDSYQSDHAISHLAIAVTSQAWPSPSLSLLYFVCCSSPGPTCEHFHSKIFDMTRNFLHPGTPLTRFQSATVRVPHVTDQFSLSWRHLIQRNVHILSILWTIWPLRGVEPSLGHSCCRGLEHAGSALHWEIILWEMGQGCTTSLIIVCLGLFVGWTLQ
jgi:hypothetical protein